jgi:hypothetical protein
MLEYYVVVQALLALAHCKAITVQNSWGPFSDRARFPYGPTR